MALLDDIVYRAGATTFNLAVMAMAAVNGQGRCVNGVIDKIARTMARPWKWGKLGGLCGFGHCPTGSNASHRGRMKRNWAVQNRNRRLPFILSSAHSAISSSRHRQPSNFGGLIISAFRSLIKGRRIM